MFLSKTTFWWTETDDEKNQSIIDFRLYFQPTNCSSTTWLGPCHSVYDCHPAWISINGLQWKVEFSTCTYSLVKHWSYKCDHQTKSLFKKRNNLHGYTSLVFLKKLRSSSSAFSDNANLPWCLSGINNADTPAYLSTLLEKDIVQQSFVCLRRVIILVCNYSKRCP